MKMITTLLITSLFFCLGANAGTKSYQVTGTILEATDSKIIIDKKGEKFEIAKPADAKASGEMTVGSKATVYYTMTATEIEVKSGTKEVKKK